MNRARHLLQSSVIVISFLALGKLTGLLRARLVSAEFGTGPFFDSFTAANQLPEVFVTLISGGALAAAFIPVYSAYLTSREAKASARLANTILTLVIIILTGISLIGIIFAPWITRTLLVPDFSTTQQLLTANIMRIILLQTTLFGISGVLSSILNAHQHFALPALAPVALDVGYIFGLFVLVPSLGIYGLAWGTVIGGLLHILIQVPALMRYQFRYRPRLAIEMAGVREIVWLMLPRVVTLGAIQIADLFIIRLTSGLPAGSTSGYFYGYYLMQLPETLFGTAIALVVFPTMAELFNSGDIDGMKRTSMSALRIIWTLTIPAAVGLLMLGQQAIALLFQGGAFDEASTRLVYGVLVFFSVRIISESTLEIVARLFYAQHNTYVPMFAALGWLVINTVLAYALVDSLGVGGLALASTVAFTIQAAALFILNRRALGPLGERQLFMTAGRSLIAAAAMSAVIFGLEQFIANQILYLIAGGTVGLAIYLLVSHVLGGREIPALLAIARSRTVQDNP